MLPRRAVRLAAAGVLDSSLPDCCDGLLLHQALHHPGQSVGCCVWSSSQCIVWQPPRPCMRPTSKPQQATTAAARLGTTAPSEVCTKTGAACNHAPSGCRHVAPPTTPERARMHTAAHPTLPWELAWARQPAAAPQQQGRGVVLGCRLCGCRTACPHSTSPREPSQLTHTHPEHTGLLPPPSRCVWCLRTSFRLPLDTQTQDP